jgi:hypothetical protein
MDNYVENVPPEHFQDIVAGKGKQGESGLVRFPLKMLSHFSPLFDLRRKYGAESFAVCGRRRGLCPRPASIFEKLLDQKTFIDLVFSTNLAAEVLRQSFHVISRFHLNPAR